MSQLRAIARVTAAGVCAALSLMAHPQERSPGTTAKSDGEQWEVTTLVEYYGPKDRVPSRSSRDTRTVCLKQGSLDMSAELITELPAQLVRSCQLGEKRAEGNRQQVKFVCTNGATAEAATRREADGSFSSQIVANLPQQWAVSIMRKVQPRAGTCDTANPVPPPPVQATPAPPG
jgi:hypothetical protein